MEISHSHHAAQDFFKAVRVQNATEKDDLAVDAELVKSAAGLSEDIHPLELKDLLVDEYGTEWLDWLPENLDFHFLKNTKNEVLSNKAQALRVSIGTDTPWQEWHIFENVGKAFNHQVPNFGIMQPLSVGECETTVKVLRDIRRDETFSEEVILYIATVCFTEGLLYIPEDWGISIAQDHLKNLVYDKDSSAKVKESWSKTKGLNLLDKKFREDDLIHRQLANLTVVQQYVKEYYGPYNRSTSEQ